MAADMQLQQHVLKHGNVAQVLKSTTNGSHRYYDASLHTACHATTIPKSSPC